MRPRTAAVLAWSLWLLSTAGGVAFVVIEACVAPDDLSPVSRKYIQASARHGRWVRA